MEELSVFTGATVLVVDDNQTNLEALSDYLTQFKLTVLLKQDGERALELLTRKVPDLILLDIIMPGMDGFETCRHIKENPLTQDIPVIFMSALSDTVDKLTGFEVGAVDYITKPFQYTEVLARVKAHLTIRQLQRNLHAQNFRLQELLEKERKTLERERKIMEDLRLNLSLSLPHELRTPLSAILGFCQLLERVKGLPPSSKVFEYARRIHKNGLRLFRLVENSLLYAHLKLLKYTPDERRSWQIESIVEAQPFITSVAERLAEEMYREDDLVLELEEANIRVTPGNFEKILIELLDNAFKFSEAGCPVSVKTTVNRNLCILSITDRGRGMSPEQIATIGAYMQFERREYEQQGNGLGLIISSLLAQLEGGVLSVDSQLQQGTTVSIVFHCQVNDYEHPEGDAPHAPVQRAISQPAKTRPALELPSDDVIDVLYEFAALADTQSIIEHLDRLDANDAKYQPFSAKLRRFINDYRLDLLQTFLYSHVKDRS